jgi:copper(I)-binding protein
MLVGLTAPLKQGDLIQLSLKFENAGEIVVPFEVKAMGAQAPGPLSHTAPTSDASGAAAKM